MIVPGWLRACCVVALAALPAACGRAPDCDEVVSSLAKYPVDDRLPVDESYARLLPHGDRLTGSDTEFLRAACHEDRWTASYRRCLAGARKDDDVVECNVADDTHAGLVWAGLPHDRAWLAELADKASAAMLAAADVARDRQQAQEQIEHRLAEVEEEMQRVHRDAGKLAKLEHTRAELQAQLAAAQEAARRAAAVAKDCEVRPLEKPACLAAIAPAK